MSNPIICGLYPLTAAAAKISTILGIADDTQLYGSIFLLNNHAHAITVASTESLAKYKIWKFTISSGSATAGATYTAANGAVMTVDATVASATTLYCHGTLTATPDAGPAALTKTSGTGDNSLSYSAVAASNLADNPLVIPATTAWTSIPKSFEAGSVTVLTATVGATNMIGIDCVKA